MNFAANRIFVSLLSASVLGFGCAPHSSAQAPLRKTALLQNSAKAETLGGGTVSAPAVGPAPSFGLGGPGLVLVKNWRFGAAGTIKNQADLDANFLYHDQHKSIANGSNAYGSLIVAPDDAHAIFPGDVYYYTDDATHSSRGAGLGQPIEGRDSAPVRQFTADSLKTFLTALKNANTKENGVLTVLPDRHEVGNGSFMASWFLPSGGSLLGQDIVWETKVRYKTPPYFWFSLWTDGDRWRWDNGARGAEHDLVESYGEDYKSEGAGTAFGNDNFDGHLWHSNSVAGSDTVNYFTGAWWGQAMADQKIKAYDASQYHIWTWVYKKDNSYTMYVDGVKVQSGTNYYWTFGNRATDSPINMSFRFDGGWGHRSVRQVDKPLPATALAGTYYEYAYSRVYLSRPVPARVLPVALPGLVRAVNYMTGGAGIAYKQTIASGQTLYRSDNSGADYGTALASTGPGQWYKYKVVVPKAGLYNLSFQAGAPAAGGTFHVEDETGKNLTGSVAVPKTGDYDSFATIQAGMAALPAGLHTLKWVQETGGYSLYGLTVGAPQAPFPGPHAVPGTVGATDYDLGGPELAYHQTNNGGQTGSRPDNSGADYGPALGWTAAGQWYKYTVNAAKTGSYLFSFQAGSPDGGTFHVEDESGKNLTGSVSVPKTGGYQTFVAIPVSAPAALSAGTHMVKWVQDSGGYDLRSMTLAPAGG